VGQLDVQIGVGAPDAHDRVPVASKRETVIGEQQVRQPGPGCKATDGIQIECTRLAVRLVVLKAHPIHAQQLTVLGEPDVCPSTCVVRRMVACQVHLREGHQRLDVVLDDHSPTPAGGVVLKDAMGDSKGLINPHRIQPAACAGATWRAVADHGRVFNAGQVAAMPDIDAAALTFILTGNVVADDAVAQREARFVGIQAAAAVVARRGADLIGDAIGIAQVGVIAAGDGKAIDRHLRVNVIRTDDRDTPSLLLGIDDGPVGVPQ